MKTESAWIAILCSTRRWFWVTWWWNPPGSGRTAPAKPVRAKIYPISLPMPSSFCRPRSSPTSWRNWTRRKIAPSLPTPQWRISATRLQMGKYTTGKTASCTRWKSPSRRKTVSVAWSSCGNVSAGSLSTKPKATRTRILNPSSRNSTPFTTASPLSTALSVAAATSWPFRRTPATASCALWRCWMSRAT